MPTKTNSPLHIPTALIGMGIKGLVGGFGEVLRDRKEAKDAGEKYSGKEFFGDFGRGFSSGVTGMDFTDQRQAEEQPTYKTNIDPMTGEEILPNQDLVNKYGIPEPLSRKKVLPDILLVPIVGFDKNLNRIGYGAGYYDRAIAKIKKRKKVLTIGLAYHFQEVKFIPINKYDYKLDFIVTDKKVF